MKHGKERFELYLSQIATLLSKSTKQKNAAMWLYQNNLRTPLFMLEALSKMYSELHNKKRFSNIKEQVKILEDALGAIDYYDTYAKQFALIKSFPKNITAYLQAQTREKIQHLNELLIEQKWIGDDAHKISDISKKISTAKWMKEKDEVKLINKYYGKAIYNIVEFVNIKKFKLDNVEADIHELRRKLRWLSIYPQALQGTIQLIKTKKSIKHLSKYCTKDVIQSPYNKFPAAGNKKHFLLLEQNYFYALSWQIANLGKIKDSGLAVIAIKEAIQQSKNISDAEALKTAYKLLGSKQLKIEQILAKASAISKIYFSENNLENLVVNISSISK